MSFYVFLCASFRVFVCVCLFVCMQVGGGEISEEVCKCTNANNADNGGSTSDLDHHFLATIKNERNNLTHDRWTVPCKNLTINI